MNKIIVFGRLTKDPEMVNTGGSMLLRFSVAEDKKFKREGHPQTNYFNCVAFGKNAESIQKYFSKGRCILITGRIDMDSYEKNGQKVNTFSVMVEEWSFGGDRPAASTGSKAVTEANEPEGFMAIPEGFAEEMPFC